MFTRHPIHVGTGNKVLEEVDYASESLRFVRTYNHLISRSGTGLGSRWTHTYSRSIAVSTDRAYLFSAEGRLLGARLVNSTISAGQQNWTVDANHPERLVRLFDAAAQPMGWMVYRSDDATERYDVSGRLASITARDATVQSLAYSDGTVAGGYVLDAGGNPTGTPLPSGLLIRVSDSLGRSLLLGHDASSRITKLTDIAGGVYRYGNDTAGNLAAVTDPAGRSTQYLYNEPAHTAGTHLPYALTGRIDETGHRLATYTYDSLGRATSSRRWADVAQTRAVSSATLSYSVDGTGMPLSTAVTDGLGTVRSYGFSTVLGVVKDTTASQEGEGACGAPRGKARTYDANGNVVSTTDWNNTVTQYRYDLARNLETVRIEGLKDQSGTVVATADTRTVITVWHPSWRLTNEIRDYSGGADAGGNPTGTLLKTTRHTYDASGNLTRKDEIAGTVTRIWSSTYTTYGRVLTATDPNGKVTTTTYYADDDPDMGRRGNVATVTNAANHVTRISAYNLHGQPTRIIDPNGLTTTLTYDPRMRLTSRTVGTELTSFGYDPVGQMTSVVLPDGASLSYTYDAAHRLTAIADHRGNRIAYTLDAMGNRINEQVTDPGGALVKNIARTVDALNRVQQVVGAN